MRKKFLIFIFIAPFIMLSCQKESIQTATNGLPVQKSSLDSLVQEYNLTKLLPNDTVKPILIFKDVASARVFLNKMSNISLAFNSVQKGRFIEEVGGGCTVKNNGNLVTVSEPIADIVPAGNVSPFGSLTYISTTFNYTNGIATNVTSSITGLSTSIVTYNQTGSDPESYQNGTGTNISIDANMSITLTVFGQSVSYTFPTSFQVTYTATNNTQTCTIDAGNIPNVIQALQVEIADANASNNDGGGTDPQPGKGVPGPVKKPIPQVIGVTKL